MGNRFTPDQQLAIEHRGNVIVSAGAGSGKTSVLVERYVRLLADEHPSWPVDAIVAITFTRKAAAELKSRIVRKLKIEMEAEGLAGGRYKRLLEIRRALGAAPIGTIHNFCGRLLRQFAFDAGIDPDYAIVEGAQESVMRSKAVRAVFNRISHDPENPLYRDLLQLVGMFSPNRLMEIFAGMLSDRANLLVPVERYVSKSPEELWQELGDFHKQEISIVREEFYQAWRSLLVRMDAIVQGGKVASIVSEAMESLPGEWEDWTEVGDVIEGFINALLVQKGTCRVAAFKNSNLDSETPICIELMELAAKYRKLNLADLEDWDKSDISLAQRFARLFIAINDEYGRTRGSTDLDNPQLLDYADLELQAERLLSNNPLVRHSARKLYPYFILDEFQDTSESQWNILKWFVLEDGGDLRRDSLFVVGDKKQGVYGFREANVNLFSDVQGLVASSNTDHFDGDGCVSMTANFRTNPVPLNFLNGVFQELLQKTSQFSVEFEPLEAFATSQQGEVEFLLVGNNEGEDDSEGEDGFEVEDELEQVGEPEMVAAHIKELISAGLATPGDIAILFRKRSPFLKYETALKALDIPVVTQQASNLFQQRELADVVAAMVSVVYPQRDYPFVHFLRSPLGGFEDNLLLKIGRTPGGCFYDKLKQVAENYASEFDGKTYTLTPDEIERIEFVLGFIRGSRKQIGKGGLYDAVSFVLEYLGARHSALANYRGVQARANLDKLLELAKASEPMTYQEFLSYIEGEEQSLRGIGEAADLSSASAVKIMTIHASKGLEFPVVYLPELNSGVAGIPATVSTDGKLWLTVRLPKGISPNTTFLAQLMTQRDLEQQKAEERRILYVAMTRAKNRLVLSADLERKPRGETFYAWLKGEFDERDDSGEVRYADEFALKQNHSGANERYTSPYLSDKFKVNQALILAQNIKPVINSAKASVKSDTSSFARRLLSDLINGVVYGSGETAWRKVQMMLGVLGSSEEEAGSMEQWEKLKDALTELVSIRRDVYPAEAIYINGNAGTSRLSPDIMIGDYTVWIAMGLAGKEVVISEAKSYNEFCSSQKRMIKSYVWEYPFEGFMSDGIDGAL